MEALQCFSSFHGCRPRWWAGTMPRVNPGATKWLPAHARITRNDIRLTAIACDDIQSRYMIEFSRMAVIEGGDHGRGLVLNQDVDTSKDTSPKEIMSVPLYYSLCIPSKCTDSFDSFLRDWQDTHQVQMPAELIDLITDDDVAVVARLTGWLVWAACEVPYFKNYVEAVVPPPGTPQSLITATRQELVELQDKMLERVTKSMQLDALHECTKLLRRLEPLLPPTCASLQHLLWGMDTVKSRSFSSPLPPTSEAASLYIPGCDLFNHKFSPPCDFAIVQTSAHVVCVEQVILESESCAQVRSDLDSLPEDWPGQVRSDPSSLPEDGLAQGEASHGLAHRAVEADMAQLRVRVEGGVSMEAVSPRGGLQFTVSLRGWVRSMAAGQDLCISYGDRLSNAQLLSNYGFIVPGNPNERWLWPDGKKYRSLQPQLLARAASDVELRDPWDGRHKARVYSALASILAVCTLGGPTSVMDSDLVVRDMIEDLQELQKSCPTKVADDLQFLHELQALQLYDLENYPTVEELSRYQEPPSEDEFYKQVRERLLPEKTGFQPATGRTGLMQQIIEYRIEQKRLLAMMVELLQQWLKVYGCNQPVILTQYYG